MGHLSVQNTVSTSVSFSGVGLHSGKPVQMTVRPAPVDHGIVFRRTDILFGDARVPARWDLARQTPLCTVIENAQGVSVATIEHVMAALAGCGVHNALIDIDGAEAPILDGSAAPFVDAILSRGVRAQGAAVRAIEILRDVEVVNGDARASFSPDDRLRIEFHIDFDDAAIGVQSKTLDMSNGSFVRELCTSRTFCRFKDVTAMREQGLALGGTMQNAVVVDGDEVLTPGGLRQPDEAVRHKMLDALGDIALAGAPILGLYRGDRAGHAITNQLLRALFETPGAFRVVTCTPDMSARLPGAGVVHGEMPRVA